MATMSTLRSPSLQACLSIASHRIACRNRCHAQRLHLLVSASVSRRICGFSTAVWISTMPSHIRFDCVPKFCWQPASNASQRLQQQHKQLHQLNSQHCNTFHTLIVRFQIHSHTNNDSEKKVETTKVHNLKFNSIWNLASLELSPQRNTEMAKIAARYYIVLGNFIRRKYSMWQALQCWRQRSVSRTPLQHNIDSTSKWKCENTQMAYGFRLWLPQRKRIWSAEKSTSMDAKLLK